MGLSSSERLRPDIAVFWVFRNDHGWTQGFDSVPARDHWINSVGLVTHPDIVRVTIYEGDWEMNLKG